MLLKFVIGQRALLLPPGAVVMVWQGTVVETSERQDATEALQSILGLTRPPHVLGCVETLPTPGDEEGTGGRVDLLFAIESDDVMVAAVKRLATDDIKWLADADSSLYAADVRAALA